MLPVFHILQKPFHRQRTILLTPQSKPNIPECGNIQFLCYNSIRHTPQNKPGQYTDAQPTLHHRHNSVVIPRGKMYLLHHLTPLKNLPYLSLCPLFQQHKGIIRKSFHQKTLTVRKGMILRQHNKQLVLLQKIRFQIRMCWQP